MGRILRRSRQPQGAGYGWTEDEQEHVGNLLAFAFPDRIARREPDGSYRLVTGRTARFPGAGYSSGQRVDVPSRASARWIAAIDADPGETTGTIRLAAPVDQQEVDGILGLAAEESLEIRWEGLVPRGVLTRRVGRLALTERPGKPDADQVAASFRDLIARQGLGVLPWNAQSTKLLARMRFLSRARPGLELGDMSDQGLVDRVGDWLVAFLKLSGGQVLTASGLFSALQGLLGAKRHLLATEVPEHLVLPTGGKRDIDYDGPDPAVEARIQEVFGLAESPLICGVPLTFRLLSPAQRPLQITRDLGSFWRTTYAEVRGEMRGRYPKHYWPENPLIAEATSRVRPKK
jgi:ATP-dependent helicase HrpB